MFSIRYNIYNMCKKKIQNVHYQMLTCTLQASENTKKIQCSSSFTANERIFAYSIMSKYSDKYMIATQNTVDVKEIDESHIFNNIYSQWEDKNTSAIIEFFEKLSDFSHKKDAKVDIMSSQMYSSFFHCLKISIPKLNDDQLESVFRALNNWSYSESSNLTTAMELFKELDCALVSKMSTCTFDKLLLFADHVYNTKFSKQFRFSNLSAGTLTSRASELTQSQLVQTLFYVSSNRNKLVNMNNLEKAFKRALNSLNIDEIAICCMGFFKSKTRLVDDNLIDLLIRRVMTEANSISDISLSAILKLIRYSVQKFNFKLQYLLDSLVSQIPRFSFLACVHIALVGSTSLFVHRQSLACIEKKFIHSPTSARLKDLERLTFVFSTFNIETDPSFYELIVNELRSPYKVDEIRMYGECLSNSLSYLAIKGVYPEDLISNVLHSDFIKNTYGKSLMKNPRCLSVLDASIEIECKYYKGNRLDTTVKDMLFKESVENIPHVENIKKMNFNQKFMLDVMMLMQKIRGGKNYIFVGYILPHFSRADIVISDRDGVPIPVSDYFDNLNAGSIMRPPNTNNIWTVMIIAGRTHFTSNTRELMANTEMKIRQLKKLGYNPVVVSWLEWKTLIGEEKKIEYLKYILKQNNILRSKNQKLTNSV